ncbi:MAG: DNA-binding protein [Prevotella sp.]|nr:DNA-binding protein [Prevotella sp.]
MFAKYIKREYPDLNGTGQTQAYYKMQTTPLSYEGFVELCCREGAMPKDAIMGVLTLVSEKLALCMAEGRAVKIDGLGTFTAKLGVRDDMLPDAFEPGERRHNAGAIEVKGVSYRADRDLVSNCSERCQLESGGVSRLHKPKGTLEERMEKARQYLKEHPLMRVDDYAGLTGLSHTAASMELRRIAENPASGITYKGSRSQKYYILRTL